jgi:hypothetical protein
MSNNDNFHKEQIHYLKTKLIEHFRKNNSQNIVTDSFKIALNHLVLLSGKDTLSIEKTLLFYAHKLKNSNFLPAIQNFASETIALAQKYHFFESRISSKNKNLKKVVSSTIKTLLSEGYSENSASNKAAFMMYKKQQQQNNKIREQIILKNHPLKENLSCLLSQKKYPKEDIKQKLLNITSKPDTAKKGQGVLYGLLTKARAFSDSNIHILLGDELFFLCRPLGFLDKNDSLLLIEVNNSSSLYALTYRKLEIINLLKKDTTFSKVKNIRFELKKEY